MRSDLRNLSDTRLSNPEKVGSQTKGHLVRKADELLGTDFKTYMDDNLSIQWGFYRKKDGQSKSKTAVANFCKECDFLQIMG